MIVGIGTDVVELDKIRNALAKHPRRLLERILSPREQEEAESASPERQAEFVAGRFAAKEALAKALGCGLARLRMPTVDICLGTHGLVVSFPAETDLFAQSESNWHISISHTGRTAFAVAILERPESPLDRAGLY